MSDNAKSEMSTKVKELHRMYCVKDHQSEPHYQHQNYAERRIQDIKKMANGIMDRVRCPSKFWLICILLYVIPLMNVLANVNGAIPQSIVTGERTDISQFLSFHFYQEVFYEEPDKGGESLGRWIGPADNKGDKLTYWVLTKDTERLIVRSNVRVAKDPMFPNRKALPDPSLFSLASEGEDMGTVSGKPVISSLSDQNTYDFS